MNLIEQIQHSFSAHLQTTFHVRESDLQHHASLTLNIDEHKQQFGDLNANAAMTLAKELKQNPHAIATKIAETFTHPFIERIEIAGPGFLNFFLSTPAWDVLAQALYSEKETFFKPQPLLKKHNFNIEFVSANPTGPLHLGHGRGGIIGDVLANILLFLGHNATREFYINDAGVQITKLGTSLKIRCEQETGLPSILPEDGYAGSYLIDLARRCIAEHGTTVVEKPDEFFQNYAQEHLLHAIKETLNRYGIHFDTWFSEKTLHTDGSIDRVITYLQQHGHLFERDGALWFKSTEFGDDKDRVLKKSSGELTYVAADAAYLKNKVDRGFDRLIMLLGHDHHSYAVRLQSLLQALDLNHKATLDVILYQLVSMKEDGKQLRMSKRAGRIVTLSDVIDIVGTDIARFFYLNRKADAHLEFDVDLALKKTDENPVYYAQYAYVRTKSILTKAEGDGTFCAISVSDAQHLGRQEALLLKKILSLKPLLESIGTNYQTHTLTYYLLELAQTFHSYYGKNRVIDYDHIEISRSRILLIHILKNSFETVLKLLNISLPEKM